MRESPNRSPAGRVKSIALLVIAGLLALGAFYVQWSWRRPIDLGSESFVVKPGTSMRGLARQLYDRGVVLEPYTFTWMGFLTGRSRQLKAGEYRFEPGISAAELLDQVVAGRVVEYPLVFVEGWNFRQLIDAVQSAPKLTQTLPALVTKEIMTSLGHPSLHP